MAIQQRKRRWHPFLSVAVLGALSRRSITGLSFVPPHQRLHIPRKPTEYAGVAAVTLATELFSAESVDAAALPPAPSGVNVLPQEAQAAIVAGIFATLGLATRILSGPGLDALRSLLPEGWFDGWQKTWPVMGVFFCAAGLSHFTAQEAFERIYPPEGTWGFWYLPGSASFHVAWTGVAELAGGAGLFLGSLALGLAQLLGIDAPKPLRYLPGAAALGLFLLTWAVTPANVYMFTHGAQMAGLTPGDQPVPVTFHGLRYLLQVVLLSFLWNYHKSSWAEAERSS